MITTIMAILLSVGIITSLLILSLDCYIRRRLDISLLEFMESVSVLTEISNSRKHKSLEFIIQSMIKCRIQDTQKLISLRQDIQKTLDKINRIPYSMLTEQDRQVRDSLEQSSNRIGIYLYQN